MSVVLVLLLLAKDAFDDVRERRLGREETREVGERGGRGRCDMLREERGGY